MWCSKFKFPVKTASASTQPPLCFQFNLFTTTSLAFHGFSAMSTIAHLYFSLYFWYTGYKGFQGIVITFLIHYTNGYMLISNQQTSHRMEYNTTIGANLE
ncbi:hypothetical protein BDZ94DRAFT_949949 [Collybia nuda]|uniref:Uncharacterized protein n=1 Tax=Collybia nuda TaxID=64659 RepID=A0A9P5XZT0_9AGAR|nr:hypothetical protein BDZ94DRAFT_949949 [Collybia nuda]